MGNVYEVLKQYQEQNIYPFHMPGHKRKKQKIFEDMHPYEVDYTEVDGLDDLHDPTEMYLNSMHRMKAFYGTEQTFYLVNGSTSGIMASICAFCSFGDTIIVGRNCHKSVYRAIELFGLHPVYIYPEIERENGIVKAISTEKFRKIVDKHPDAKAVLLVSPTYEGMVMDIKAISAIIKEKEIPFIVDEAHGAHFPFGDDFPHSAIELGADVVIQSLHKTMPALTQTALLHLCSHCVSKKAMQECIDYFETTSPSYLLAASIDDAFEFGRLHREKFHEYFDWLCHFRKELLSMKNLYLVQTDDPGKIVISTSKTNMTGKELYDILLKKYRLQMEMAQETYCLAMTSVCDTEDGFKRLEDALKEIDRNANKCQEKKRIINQTSENVIKYIPAERKKMPLKEVVLEKSIGCISGDYIYLYPPGIPFLVPGELIEESCIQKIKDYKIQSFHVKGLVEKDKTYIRVFDE